VDCAEASARLGEPTDRRGLFLAEALTIDPIGLTRQWLEGCEVRIAEVARLERDGAGWRLIDAGGEVIAEAEVVCIAAGANSASLEPETPLAPVRGQVSFARLDGPDPNAALWGGYVVPTGDGVLFGATHDRGRGDVEVTALDHQRNLAQLAEARPQLAARLTPEALEGRASVRAVTPDFLPLAGAASEARGLYVLSGLGSRGFCAAPLLAEHIAAQALDAASPLPARLQALVDPARFAMRRIRRLARISRNKGVSIAAPDEP
jgi:tRNA 5-methylaminomethyl-2-thiouridine biosynthesis bifunctional protein